MELSDSRGLAAFSEIDLQDIIIVVSLFSRNDIVPVKCWYDAEFHIRGEIRDREGEGVVLRL